MAGSLYNLLHGWLPGSGFLGRSASGSGPAALLSGADAVALLPAATASVDGKMTAAQATIVAGLGSFRGVVTQTQRDALSSLSAGDWVINTSQQHRIDVYDDNGIWLGATQIKLINKTAAASVYGKLVALGSSSNYAVFAGYEGDPGVVGVVDKSGVSDGSWMPVSTGGIVDVLMAANEVVTPAKFIRSDSSGLGVAKTTPEYGTILRPLESKTSSSNFIVTCIFHRAVA